MTTSAVPGLVGREQELARIEHLQAQAREGGSGALVVRGEAGIGKTALLEAAAAMAAGMRVLHARGIESEADLPFAGLVELLRPLRDSIERLPPHLAAVLRGALGLGPAVVTAPLQLGVAVLSLLSAEAETCPLLVTVDDAHWLDGASSAALLFAARRLGPDGVAMLFAVRDGEPAMPVTVGLEELTLSGLDSGSARALLAGDELSDDVIEHLQLAMRGNPLALIEGARLLSADQRAGRASLDEVLRPGRGIERAFSRRLAALGSDARDAVLLVSAANGSHAGVIAAALENRHLSLATLSEAEACGVIILRGDRIDFAHPLLRSVAYHTAPAIERRAAHLALAEALADEEPARSVLHRAQAATEPDELLASALERVALEAADRGAPMEASLTLGRAAALTPERDGRARRLLRATQMAVLAGDFRSADDFIERGLTEATATPTRAAFEVQRGFIEIAGRSPRAGADRMVAAAARFEAEAPGAAGMMLYCAALASFMAGECRWALELSERAVELTRTLGGFAALYPVAARAGARILLGAGAGEAATLLAVHEQVSALMAAGARPDVPPAAIAQHLGWVERFDDSSRILRAAIAAARAASAPMTLPYDLAALAELEQATGELTAAYADASEAVQFARDERQLSFLAFALVTLARIEALQGREPECRAHVAEALELADDLGVGSITTYAGSALGVLELGLGHAEAAVYSLERVSEAALRQGLEEPSVVRWQPDLVEAYLRCDRAADAERELEILERRARKTGGTWSAAATLRCCGLMAAAGEFDACFEEALNLHATQPLTFERARTELCHGERLRRAGRLVEAREPLRRAFDAFERMGGRPWVEMARSELLAAGEGRVRGQMAGDAELTAQELQVVRVVAAGASNAEAAAQLFVSTKTVEKHLTSAYRKLGVRSRAQLAARFAASEPRAEQ